MIETIQALETRREARRARREQEDESVAAVRAAGGFMNHVLNNRLQRVLYRAENLAEHEDPQVAEAGRQMVECIKSMARTVRLVQSAEAFATIPCPSGEPMLDPRCLCSEEEYAV